MVSFMKEFQHLRIQLEEIKKATNNFGKKAIGSGGFGDVYEGEMLLSKGRSTVAIKRLNRQFGQGDPEFLKEIMMLSRYRHQNLISLLGFCDEEDEKVLVYEYASKGSLDRHLSDPGLTWTQRIKICLGAAKGLRYLHDPNGAHQRVLHCDIKSANILLDESLTAKVANFGLSKMGSTNHQYSVLITNASGTPGYCDPLYMMTYTLTKESDVYSFGVVLLEVLSGRLCFQYSNRQVNVFVPMWKQKFSENKIHEIVFQHLMPRMHPTSLELFSDIAFQCLHDSREGRPTMSIVVEKLESALEFQELYDLKLPNGYKELLMTAIPPLKFRSVEDLNVLFSNGVLLNAGKTWFSINDHGEHSELISIAECLVTVAGENYDYSCNYNSRFPVGALKSKCNFKTCLRPQFLSPHITYTVNLVFKFYPEYEKKNEHYIWLAYQLEGESGDSTVYMAYKREDNWWTAELFQFSSNGPTFSLYVTFKGRYREVLVEGIKFQPLEKVERQVSEDEKPTDMQLPISESNYDEIYWEQRLPNDYQDIIKQSKHKLQWTTKKELYSIFSKGFLIVNNCSFSEWRFNTGCEQWFSLDKRGKTCLTLSLRMACRLEDPSFYKYTWEPLPESRFGEVLVLVRLFKIVILLENRPDVLSPQTRYASYLVYKLPENRSRNQEGCLMNVSDTGSGEAWYIFLHSPQTPVVRPKVGENTHNPSARRPKVEDLPQQRSDGWMEVKFYEFQIDTTQGVISNLKLEDVYHSGLRGMIIQCIEIRTI